MERMLPQRSDRPKSCYLFEAAHLRLAEHASRLLVERYGAVLDLLHLGDDGEAVQ